ncbi:MAG: 2-amino-4-hydroxy-6-hydroxymethyldihydropteridine diphosphokinase, partial [Dehalococcoidales bacterium]|nr:2-amino-4-hydroxy-6-hydroxymethyldihydropteridine diphosphokinase [Dehalococcoidales bacterium]
MSSEPVMVYLGLGSNMGDREGNLDRALDLLGQRLRMGEISSTYDTEPVGDTDQPRFLNLVCQVSTSLTPAALLAIGKGIELRLGRLPGKRNAPRPIDVDILFYDGQVIESPELVV